LIVTMVAPLEAMVRIPESAVPEAGDGRNPEVDRQRDLRAVRLLVLCPLARAREQPNRAGPALSWQIVASAAVLADAAARAPARPECGGENGNLSSRENG
jgi:hypothetical protein